MHRTVSTTRLEYVEGFETGVPPPGWSLSRINMRETWRQSPIDPFEGGFCAACFYDEQLGQQDEWLRFSRTIVADEATLTFAVMGSVYWSTSPHQNYNLLVTIDDTVVWDYRTENLGTSWVWEVHRVDLSAYVGRTVAVGFGYQGMDGAEGDFDAVSLSGYTPPPPAVNEICATAIRIPCGEYQISGSTAHASNDYTPEYPSSCTGYSASGPDVVFYTDLKTGESFQVTMETSGHWDDSIYLLADCGEETASCVAGADAYPDHSTFQYTAVQTGRYFLIVDGFGGASGDFSIWGLNGCSPVAVLDVDWSTIKAIYR